MRIKEEKIDDRTIQLEIDEHTIYSQESAYIIEEKDTTSSTIQKQIEINRQIIKQKPFEIYLRHEEDVIAAYRDYYRDQIVNDKRNELGRFLFGVSFTTLGFIVSILKFSSDINSFSTIKFCLLGTSGLFLLTSSLFGLLLAYPRNQEVDPTTLDIVALHRANSNELARRSVIWFLFWVIGLIIGLLTIIT